MKGGIVFYSHIKILTTISMKKQLLFSLLLFFGFTGYAQVTLSGKITDPKGEPIPSVIVTLKKNGVPKANAQADFDGLYRITNLDPGKYDIEFTLVGFGTQVQSGVSLTNGTITVNQTLSDDPKLLGEVVIKEYKVPIVKVDQTTSGGTLTSDQIAKLPTKDITSLIAAAAPGIAVSPDGRDVNLKGSRSASTDYYVDGIRVRGSTVPANEIEQIEVVTGGIEAKYGDVTGGLISITTKGPASKFTGGIEVESSQFLNSYGYNFLNANVSGPLLTRTVTDKSGGKYKESILGFRLAGQLRTNGDPSPPAVGVYRVKDDVAAALAAKPITTIGGTQVASAELLGKENFDLLKIHPNAGYKQYDFNAKLDAKLSKAMDITLSGGYIKIEDKITPDDGNPRFGGSPASAVANLSGGSGKTWEVFNSQYNPTDFNDRFRTNLRFRHRLGGNTEGGNKVKSTATTIENAQYTLQLGYERNFRKLADARHGENFFNYGYVGQFDYQHVPDVPEVADTLSPTGLSRRHVGYRKELKSYKRAEINPILANYNNGVDVDLAGSKINVLNGSYNQANLASVWNYHQNIGAVYDQYRKDNGSLITGSATLNFDIIPGGSKERAHNIQIGAVYEQRDESRYILRPFNLWNLADALQDGNINGSALDTSSVIGDTLIDGKKIRLLKPLKNTEIENQVDLQFYKRYRQKFGLPELSYGNVNNLTPDQMSLDLFTARELNERELVDYYGYDYLGNKLGGNVSFKDFFSSKDANGIRTFPVASFKPLYIGGYIQDKFRYKDIIFSLGVRIDRFDANTKVLKDPLSLYEIITAKDYYDNVLKVAKPSNIGDDYKVYVGNYTKKPTDAESNIKGFRSGEQWYTKAGQPIDPIALFGPNTKTYPRYQSPDVESNYIKNPNFNPDVSFEDYKPQTNVMPRLAFSFPISDVANFFAHYDILVARPPSNNIVTALNYFYFDDVGRTPEDNPNLKPERTIDYEVGFQQKVNNYSGIKIGAYYKELRDMIQLRFYKFIPAPLKINEYTSYGNLDFGTVKGFTFQYDLRQISHISGSVNYTLQFADGTGSDPGSQRNLNTKGNIRVLSPLSFDERHRFTATVDYRFDDVIYDGPRLFGTDFFKNAGINLQLITVSGRPYTERFLPQTFGGTQIVGGINGARLPWSINLDMRIDKTFAISKNPKRPLDINVYFRVQNLLDTRNVAQVYSASGSSEDDGYLSSERGIREVENVTKLRPNDIAAYLHSYQMREIRPDFYFFPRRMFIGATFNF